MLDGGAIFPAGLPDVNEKDVPMSTIERLGRVRRAVWRAAGSVLLPPVCCLCGAPGQAPDLDLCDVCTTLLPVLGGGSRESMSAIGGDTLVRTLFLFKYAYPIDHFIRAVKFRGERVFARVLGELLAREHRSRGWAPPACIVPMPLHLARLRERGFNQSLEIARFAAVSLGARVHSQSLVRRVATREQSGLSLEARRKNVRGAFEVVQPLPAGRIALLDDVVTTGSTATAAIDALRAAGAREIELWAIARVEKSGVDVFEQYANEN
jgi:ComF family protein